MIEAYLPRPDELWFRRKMLADEATMAYNRAYGGTVDFPEERWPDWYGRWVAHPEGRYYRYLRESASGEFVGEIAYHFDGEKYLADVIVYAPYRRRGYGAAGLALLCAAAKEIGVGVLYDDIAADNPSSPTFPPLRVLGRIPDRPNRHGEKGSGGMTAAYDKYARGDILRGRITTI